MLAIREPSICLPLRILAALSLALGAAGSAWGKEPTGVPGASPGDWPQWGGSPSRNNASDATGLPAEWDVGRFDFRTGKWLGGSVKNVLWVARLGSQSYGSPVIAGGKVFCATNNEAGYLDRYPAKVDLGCLLAFRQSDGSSAWNATPDGSGAGGTARLRGSWQPTQLIVSPG